MTAETLAPARAAARRYDRGAVWSWCLYDFANSPFTTLVVTFIFSTYFTARVAPDQVTGTALWSRGVAVTAFAVALLSPILGAFADRGGFRKLFVLFFTAVCIAGTVGLYGALPGDVGKALALFVIANVAFEMASVFYNAFLPDIAPPQRIGFISGAGWALGYLGGLLVLVIALFGFIQPEQPWFGLTRDADQHVRATNLLVAGWFAVFSLPLLLRVREDRSAVTRGGSIMAAGLRQLVATLHEIRQYRQVVRFLLARLVYNDGLVTIFAFGAIYAQAVFAFTQSEIIVFGIVLNLTAGLGAFLLGFLDDRLGGKKTLVISLVGLGIATVLAMTAPNKAVFWVAGIVVGIFSGPNQSASRSLMGRFAPPDKENEFFGFFAFSGKATAFLGPFLLGSLTAASGSHRVGISIVLVLFLIGLALLLRVDEAEGIRAAAREG
jgi:UMF1 family MFS transporter